MAGDGGRGHLPPQPPFLCEDSGTSRPTLGKCHPLLIDRCLPVGTLGAPAGARLSTSPHSCPGTEGALPLGGDALRPGQSLQNPRVCVLGATPQAGGGPSVALNSTGQEEGHLRGPPFAVHTWPLCREMGSVLAAPPAHCPSLAASPVPRHPPFPLRLSLGPGCPAAPPCGPVLKSHLVCLWGVVAGLLGVVTTTDGGAGASGRGW